MTKTQGQIKAVFEGLVYDEQGRQLEVAYVGAKPCYVIDDDGFLRHIKSEPVDRQIIVMFQEQALEHKDILAPKIMEMIGKEDLFTKVMIDDAFEKMNPDDILETGLPADARNMMGMAGFRIVLNFHGEIVDLKVPAQEADWDK
jgi:hypothetical protein